MQKLGPAVGSKKKGVKLDWIGQGGVRNPESCRVRNLAVKGIWQVRNQGVKKKFFLRVQNPGVDKIYMLWDVQSES